MVVEIYHIDTHYCYEHKIQFHCCLASADSHKLNNLLVIACFQGLRWRNDVKKINFVAFEMLYKTLNCELLSFKPTRR